MTGGQNPQYCFDCGELLGPKIVVGGASDAGAACRACGSTTVQPEPDTEEFGACGNCGRPIGSVGAFCRWCGEEVRSAFEAAVAAGRLVPNPFDSRWPFSGSYGDGAGSDAPPCSHCGEPVRRAGGERDHPLPGYAKPPWNAGWDGRCEMCGARFEVVLTTRLHFHARRTMTVKPASRAIETFIDEGFVLSGVEVTVTETDFSGSPCTQSLFLSMAELTSITEALEGSVSIYRNQLDWAHDWT